MSPATPICPADSVTTPPSASVAELLGQVVAARDLDNRPCTPATWFWHGYLGPGKITLLTSQWKSGKTTLLSLLLARLEHGGRLADLEVAPAKALVISEESQADWLARFQRLGIHDHVDLLCRPFKGQPSMEQWLALLETAAHLHRRRGTALVVIDSLPQFLPAHSENSAAPLLECLAPLQGLAETGACVLLLHHPRKGKNVAGQAARGSGALPAFVDVLIEMSYFSQPDDLDRRRRLVAFSRHDETPRHLLLELKPDGADYAVLQSGVEATFGDNWQAVMEVLRGARTKMTRPEILQEWPEDYPKPDLATLWRWLSRAVAQGVVRQQGTGRPRDPFRYWLPDLDHLMRPDGGTPEELHAWNQRCLDEIFGSLGNTPVMPKKATFAMEDESAGALTPLPPIVEVPAPVFEDDEDAEGVAACGAPPFEEEAPARARTAENVTRLPFPYNLMKLEEVPEEVWEED